MDRLQIVKDGKTVSCPVGSLEQSTACVRNEGTEETHENEGTRDNHHEKRRGTQFHYVSNRHNGEHANEDSQHRKEHKGLPGRRGNSHWRNATNIELEGKQNLC